MIRLQNRMHRRRSYPNTRKQRKGKTQEAKESERERVIVEQGISTLNVLRGKKVEMIRKYKRDIGRWLTWYVQLYNGKARVK